MNKLSAAICLELRALYGINRLLHTKDKKEKNRVRLLGVVWIFLVLMVFFYVGGLSFGFCSLGLDGIVPAYLTVIASLLILTFGLFKAGYTVFGPRGYDLLSSMPLNRGTVAIARLVTLYAEDLALTLLILLPGLTVFAVLQRPSFLFYPSALLGVICIPAIPLALSVLPSTLIMGISARTRHKSLIQTILSVGLVVGVLLLSFRSGNTSENISPEQLVASLGNTGVLFGSLYPPAVWLSDAMLGKSFFGLLWFVFVSVGAIALCLLICVRYFHTLVRRLGNIAAKHDYKMETQAHRGLRKALFIREWKRYLSSGIYVTNTVIGPIMGLILSGTLFFTGLDTASSVFPFDIRPLIPFAVAAVFGMMPATAATISMEGKQFWIIRSLPIGTKPLFDSKILMNLSLMLPFYLGSEVFLFLAVRPDPFDGIWLILIPALTMLFCAVFGLWINVKFHDFDWEKEEQVVKQGVSTLIGGFAGALVALIGCGLLLLLPFGERNWICGGFCLLLFLSAVVLYRRSSKISLTAL